MTNLNLTNNDLLAAIFQAADKEYLGTVLVNSASAWGAIPGFNPQTNFAYLIPNSGGSVRYTDLVTGANLVTSESMTAHGQQFFAKTQASASANFFLVMYRTR